RDTPGDRSADDPDTESNAYNSPSPASSELVPISPRRELRPQRTPDTHQLEALGRPRQADVVRGHSETSLAKASLTRLNRFPPLLERREVPPLALSAHNPQPPIRHIERQPPSDRKGLDHLIR